MASVLILARVEVAAIDLPSTESYYRRLGPALLKVDGFEGLSVWRGEIHPNRLLVLYHYRDGVAADRGLQALMTEKPLVETITHQSGPANVTRIAIEEKKGTALQSTPIGKYLSMSMRVSDPGYGEDLSLEINDIFSQLALMPGYLGSLQGVNTTLEEERVGLVTWDSKESFQASVPPGTLYELHLYRRVL